MRFKLIILVLYVLGLAAPAALLAQPSINGAQAGDRMIVKLDLHGERGPVEFDHKKHEAAVNPDPGAEFKAKQGASCGGCHHTVSKAAGIPQLIKCVLCHRSSGDQSNPKSRSSEEIWSKAAFHNLCVTCHQASKKGPIKCGDCHK